MPAGVHGIRRGVPVAAAGSVMATGILSVGLRLDGLRAPSAALLALAAALWAALAGVFAIGAARDRVLRSDAAGDPASLTTVAATAVLGSRLALAGVTAAAWALAALAAALAALLLPRAVRRLGRRVDGASFLIPVAVQALAVLLAGLAAGGVARWAARAALVLALAGAALYAAVLSRFDARQLVTGAGDQWVLGGAAAITALAAASIRLDDVAPGVTGALAWTAWGWALLCLGPLCGAELARPRLRYDVRRWATAFPVAMYAAASFAVAAAERAPAPRAIAHVAVWAAVAVWLAVAHGALRRVLRAARTDRSSTHAVQRGRETGI